MHILLIHQYFLEEDDGGGSRFNEMSKYWRDLGHDVTVVAGMMHANGSEKRAEYKGRWFMLKNHGGIKVLRCHVSESYNANFLGRLWGYFSFVFSSVYGGLFKCRDQYDIVLVTSPPLFVGITAIILSGIKRLPFVFEVRDLWPESAIDTGVLKNRLLIHFAFWFEKVIYKKAALINVLTPAFRIKLIEDKQVDPSKVIMIPNGADFSLADHVMSLYRRQEERIRLEYDARIVITYVGAHGVANDLMQVVEVAEEIQHTIPEILFVLIGDGMEKPKLVKEIETRNLSNIKLVDSVPKAEVFRYILASDFGLSILKKVDTFKTIYSNKTFDYMSCRTPILMVIDGVSRDLVETARCGVYIPPGDTDAFVGQLNDIRVWPEEKRSDMGLAGHRYAKEYFDRKKLAQEYLNSIELIGK